MQLYPATGEGDRVRRKPGRGLGHPRKPFGGLSLTDRRSHWKIFPPEAGGAGTKQDIRQQKNLSRAGKFWMIRQFTSARFFSPKRVRSKNPCGIRPHEAFGSSHFACANAIGFFAQNVRTQLTRDYCIVGRSPVLGPGLICRKRRVLRSSAKSVGYQAFLPGIRLMLSVLKQRGDGLAARPAQPRPCTRPRSRSTTRAFVSSRSPRGLRGPADRSRRRAQFRRSERMVERHHWDAGGCAPVVVMSERMALASASVGDAFSKATALV